MLDPVDVWKDKFADLPKTGDASWAKNLADYVDSLVTGKLQITEISPPSTFTFQKAIFEALLTPIVFAPTPVPQTAISVAWASAMTASTMVVASGSSIGAPAPVTTFSAPPVTLLLPPTIVAAQAALLAQLIAAAFVSEAKEAVLPKALYEAFKAVKASVIGLDSTPTPAGPLPLILPAGSLG